MTLRWRIYHKKSIFLKSGSILGKQPLGIPEGPRYHHFFNQSQSHKHGVPPKSGSLEVTAFPVVFHRAWFAILIPKCSMSISRLPSPIWERKLGLPKVIHHIYNGVSSYIYNGVFQILEMLPLYKIQASTNPRLMVDISWEVKWSPKSLAKWQGHGHRLAVDQTCRWPRDGSKIDPFGLDKKSWVDYHPKTSPSGTMIGRTDEEKIYLCKTQIRNKNRKTKI